MKIHEYQAKQIFTQFGVRVPKGNVAENAAQAYEVARGLGGRVVVKAQIHAGGRGKGGGVKLVRTAQETERFAQQVIGSTLVTPQTGPNGKTVRRVLVEQALCIAKEFYLGIIIDRRREQPVLMASRAGGVDIEEVARRNPELILKEHVDPGMGLRSYQVRKISFALGMNADKIGKALQLMTALYQAFASTDASLAEVNPLVLTPDGELYALDAKMNFDDNALFRHPEILKLRDFEEEDPLEVQASRSGLSYIRLDGTVGCMVNGAGLAMATMDIIKLAGGSPANFLDVGGGSNVEQVKNAFKILLADPRVKSVLINIFGGIMRCDTVARGVVEAANDTGINLPVVVRLEGTNVEQGREILQNSGLHFDVAKSMADAAEKVSALASG